MPLAATVNGKPGRIIAGRMPQYRASFTATGRGTPRPVAVKLARYCGILPAMIRPGLPLAATVNAASEVRELRDTRSSCRPPAPNGLHDHFDVMTITASGG